MRKRKQFKNCYSSKNSNFVISFNVIAEKVVPDRKKEESWKELSYPKEKNDKNSTVNVNEFSRYRRRRNSVRKGSFALTRSAPYDAQCKECKILVNSRCEKVAISRRFGN